METNIKIENLWVLLVKPNEKPRRIFIKKGLEYLQREVGGNIEVVYPFEDPVALIADGEGKLKGRPWNRALLDTEGGVYDIIAGDFLVLGLGEDDFISLRPDLMKKYERRFWIPEKFVYTENGIGIVHLYGYNISGKGSSFCERDDPKQR